MTKAKIVQFRRGRHTIQEHHMIIEIDGVTSRAQAEKFVGKEAKWTSPGKLKKVIKGKISSAHGNKGAVRAIFEKGLPGQSVGTEVKISNEDKVKKTKEGKK